MNPKVSILIPIYNVSPYIERCAHSLFRQTFRDIEYIFVNDATLDDSMEKLYAVMTQYPDRKEQIKVIHHSTNRGLAATRNTAINAACGKYIATVDSDDSIDPAMVAVLYQCAEEENADIVVSDFLMEYSTKSIILSESVADSMNERLGDIITRKTSYGSLCNKLIRRTLYSREDCRPPEGLNYMEDRHVVTRLYYYANKVVKVNQAFYHYVHYNSGSLTKIKNRMHFENVILFWKLLDQFLMEKGINETYKKEVIAAKMSNKCQLLLSTHSYFLRKEYADMLSNDEMDYLEGYGPGQKMIIGFIHHRLFGLAHLLYRTLWCKNRILFYIGVRKS